MAACGQTSEQRLQPMHFAGSQTGTLSATPRFSYFAMAMGMTPSAYSVKVLTGMLSPSARFIGIRTFRT